MLWEKGLEKGQENPVQNLGPRAGAAKWRVRGGGERGEQGDVGGGAGQGSGEQLQRRPGDGVHTRVCSFCATAPCTLTALFLHVSLLINHIPSQPDR